MGLENMYMLYMHYYNYTLYIIYTCPLISYIFMCIHAYMYVLHMISYILSLHLSS